MDTTIAAVSTALSESGIGIIRISGPESFSVMEKVFRPKNPSRKKESHTIHYGHIFDGETLIDEVLVMIMKAPHTYTGEDTVEIDCHGGVYSVMRVLETVLRNGAVTAEPGEFTKRAFLNGRIDLSQAEAVMDVISAKNGRALESSMKQLKGGLHEKIQSMRKTVLHEIAYIEAALDDPEHMSLDGYPERLSSLTDRLEVQMKRMIESFSEGKIIREGIRTVILGKPNAGKSSLLNLLAGEEKAIVTEIAGTTRDYLEEYINLQGITLHLIDTAGIRKTKDAVEKIGVARARELADQADLILYVVDSSTPLDENDEEIISMLDRGKAVVLYNKTDLSPAADIKEVEKKTGREAIPFSAKTSEGVDDLTARIKELFFSGEIRPADDLVITNARHREALTQALQSLAFVKQGILDGMPEDFLSIDLRNVCDSLGKITGETVGEDLVNEIFSKFCMGK